MISAEMCDWSKRGVAFEHVDVALHASHELKHIEAHLHQRLGEDGVMLLCGICRRGITNENTAKERGVGFKNYGETAS